MMNRSAASDRPGRLPEVPYSVAVGDVRLVYDALADALGVRLVNLVYRHLATLPLGLEWAWSVVGPRFLDGTLAREASGITRLVTDKPVLDGRAAVLRLSRIGLHDGEAQAVMRTIDAYNRANPINAISLQVLARALATGTPATGFVPPAAVAPDVEELLPMASLSDLSADTRDMMRELARQLLGSDTRLVPSLFLHFGRWPDLLAALSRLVAQLGGKERVDVLHVAVAAAAQGIGREIHVGLPCTRGNVLQMEDATRAAVSAAIDRFFPAICRMTVVGNLVRHCLRP